MFAAGALVTSRVHTCRLDHAAYAGRCHVISPQLQLRIEYCYNPRIGMYVCVFCVTNKQEVKYSVCIVVCSSSIVHKTILC